MDQHLKIARNAYYNRSRASLVLLVALASTPHVHASVAPTADVDSNVESVGASSPHLTEHAATATTATDGIAISSKSTRSSLVLRTAELQKTLAGVNPLKALQLLPGVSFQTADPWGNNEQNFTMWVHGFSAQQLGYTLDDIPLGDQQYGNYNGLSPQRAISSENVASAIFAAGAGSVGTASSSNLGGTITLYSSSPLPTPSLRFEQTIGSYQASRSFARFDTGAFGVGDRAYVSLTHLDAKAWDFDGRQGGDQLNAKWTRDTTVGTFTAFVDISRKIEPNEDPTVHVAGEPSAPYTRPFFYPDFDAAKRYLGANGTTPRDAGPNYRNYYGAAQRNDELAYLKLDTPLTDTSQWRNQLYYHHDDGAGIVAGPITVAGLPALFSVYFPNQDLKQVFGGSGFATRATEYRIHRAGWLSSFQQTLGAHQINLGMWWEHNHSSAYRRWYALNQFHPSSPYDRPSDPRITQYGSDIRNQLVQLSLQDEWQIDPTLVLQAGVKSSLQFASGRFPVQPLPGAIGGGSLALPEGEINTKKWVLPQLGLRWDFSSRDQLFANVQQNLRQFITYGAGAASPWSLSNQAAFDLFKQHAEPETATTFELGLRNRLHLSLGWLSDIESQISFYHVDFKNRLLQISATPAINAIVGANPVLANVGGVQTRGIDLAITAHLGSAVTLYNATSYNRSVYTDDYLNGKAVVPTNGKRVPGSPDWLNKTTLSARIANWQAQLVHDVIGKRYTTYTNDLSVPGYGITSLSISTPATSLASGMIKRASFSLSISNLSNRRGISGVVVGAASGTYNSYPIPPRQVFLTASFQH